MSSLLLLEPYRSALFVDGLSAGMVSVVGDAQAEQEPSYRIGNSVDLQQAVRELALFHDSVQIIQHEEPGQAEELAKRGHSVFSALGLRDSGIVEFAHVPPNEARNSKLASEVRSVQDFWRLERENFEIWRPLVASQIVARGKLAHVGLFDVLMYDRLGEPRLKEAAIAMLPQQVKELVPSLLAPYQGVGIDFVAISTLNELVDADSVVAETGINVAIDGSFGGTREGVNVDATSEIVSVVIEILLNEELRFPVPENLRELQRLRDRTEMRSFRSLFQPWIEALSVGNADAERRLRAEVRRSLRKFKNCPRLKTAGCLASYIAIPVGAVPFFGTIPSALLSLTGNGLGKLAEHWKRDSKWIGLCAQAPRFVDS
ncbi:hypothetical protein ACPF7Z_19195 [Halomonas sp. GXIMD04776]|uniref:hypothetical protein n=1 Tax=Halomonas sp. GXIMD04776 TaxID=3415605 RepID=UPI003C86B4ED